MKVRFAWYDLWIGAYWDRKRRVLYVCPLPTILFVFGNSIGRDALYVDDRRCLHVDKQTTTDPIANG